MSDDLNPFALANLISPHDTAVLVSEMQRGIVGDLAPDILRPLTDAVRETGLIESVGQLVDGARTAGAQVIHTTLQFRPRRAGVKLVTPWMAVVMRSPEYMLADSAQADLVPELAPRDPDIVAKRYHGMSAFAGTDLDMLLRGLDVRTLVFAGVSLNEAIIGAAIEAVNLGYRIAVVRDAALGVPASFGADMLRHAFAMLGPVVSVEEVLEVWSNS
jgi:nicotinamidase-related amidase